MLQRNPATGRLLKLPNGALMKQCCCQPQEEGGWFRCEPQWCEGAFTAPQRWPGIDVAPKFMTYISGTKYETWEAEGRPKFTYDNKQLWEITEFLTGDPNPTEEYYSANGWMVVDSGTGNPFDIMSCIEFGCVTTFGAKGFLSEYITPEDTVVNADTNQVLHAFGFWRWGGEPPSPPQGTELLPYLEQYHAPSMPSYENVDIELGHPPNHNKWRDIEIEYDPDDGCVVTNVSESAMSSFPAAGLTTCTFSPANSAYYLAESSVDFLGVNRPVSSRARLTNYSGQTPNQGGIQPYPNSSQCGYQGNIVMGIFHWEFDITAPGAVGHYPEGAWDYTICLDPNNDPYPCGTYAGQFPNVPDCVVQGPPCSVCAIAGQLDPFTGLLGCGFLVPTAPGAASGYAYSERIDICQVAFGETCPGGSASDLFSQANSFSGVIYGNGQPSDSTELFGIGVSFDDTGMAEQFVSVAVESQYPDDQISLYQSALAVVVRSTT